MRYLKELGLPLQLSPRAVPMSPSKNSKPPPGISIIPFEPLDPTAPAADPRQQFRAEYQAVKEWARRPLRLPEFKILKGPSKDGGKNGGGGGDGDDRGADGKPRALMPSVSWSQSPSRDYGEPEVATMKNKAVPLPPQPPGSITAGGSLRRPGSAAATGVGGSRFDDCFECSFCTKT